MKVELLHKTILSRNLSTLVFQVELSTSALLEWTRHQNDVDYAVKSTRYCTKGDVEGITFTMSNSEKVNKMLEEMLLNIKTLIKENPTIGNDDLKLLLPQAFNYKMQVQFTLPSLVHFFKLRGAKSAHYHIRDLSNDMQSVVESSLDEVEQEIYNKIWEEEEQ